MKRKVTLSMIKQMINLKKKGIHINEISCKLGVSDRTINKYTKKFPHPKRKVKVLLPKRAKKFSLEKAELIGYLCAEGISYNYNLLCREYDNRRKKVYLTNRNSKGIIFSNLNKTIQDRFIHLMKLVYDYELKFDKKGNFWIRRKEVIKDLHKYTKFGSKKWNVPKILFNNKYKSHAFMFIRAFCDGDGTVEQRLKEIRIDSTNNKSLYRLNQLINYLNIKSRYNTYKSRNRIVIRDIFKYDNYISFFHPIKLKKLKALLWAQRRSPNKLYNLL